MVVSSVLCGGRDRSPCGGCVEADAVWDPGTKPGSTPAEAVAGCPAVGGGVDDTGGGLFCSLEVESTIWEPGTKPGPSAGRDGGCDGGCDGVRCGSGSLSVDVDEELEEILDWLDKLAEIEAKYQPQPAFGSSSPRGGESKRKPKTQAEKRGGGGGKS